jgi:divalent metal cation (Fe/Co/Zn/Cd) transporter
MDLQTEIKWIHDALSESKDPTFVEAVKNMIKSMRKVKESQSFEQVRQDELMAEAEADIKAERVYSVEEAHKIVDGWKL